MVVHGRRGFHDLKLPRTCILTHSYSNDRTSVGILLPKLQNRFWGPVSRLTDHSEVLRSLFTFRYDSLHHYGLNSNIYDVILLLSQSLRPYDLTSMMHSGLLGGLQIQGTLPFFCVW